MNPVTLWTVDICVDGVRTPQGIMYKHVGDALQRVAALKAKGWGATLASIAFGRVQAVKALWRHPETVSAQQIRNVTGWTEDEMQDVMLVAELRLAGEF